MVLATLDLTILGIYVVMLVFLGWWVSRREKASQDAKDYFLAGNSLPWWALGASLIAANISAEQIIGMSGSGYAIGLAIASYEWMAAITLILVGKYLLPVFIKNRIYTMPQFLEQRFDSRVKMVMALFWLGVYIFVNLTSVLWLGALAIYAMTGLDMMLGMVFLAALSMAYSLYGGLRAVAYTDIIQVILLVAGGLFLSWQALNMLSPDGVWAGFNRLTELAPQKFDMILSPDNPHYQSLPGISVLIGGLWVMNISYWGFNQYIIQRTLAAKSLSEAQKGIAFAAFLKLLVPFIVVIPGIAAFVLLPELDKPDQAYPELMKLMPEGLRGLLFAALVAAIVSSIASMCNSISTIFTLDIFARYREVKPPQLLAVGRLSSVVALVIAVLVAQPLLGRFDQAFQYIQEFTSLFTPGIVALFLLGMFWSRTTANAALVMALGGASASLAFKLMWPTLPFMDRVGLVFLLACLLGVWVSLRQSADVKADVIQRPGFVTGAGFNLSAVAISLILTGFYLSWW
ncbi:sodium/sugar symporter [Bowmanella sp. Y26]|uniref:sodium/sugar symporter n=1 Tax=Bowmanella yangjiangensis TaxID=2811230 RepID=UPI001BDBBA92|nr:sodium/sugar symporter [Bowmanella yangjiangensis]MBT1063382.1 sodium/sugar symporter [Bowmanella yangjiangensis]